MSLPLFATVIAILGSAATALASPWPGDGDHAIPCRPTIACTADIVPAGTLEVEAGYLLRRLPGAVDQHSTPLLIKFTVADPLQLQLGSNGYTHIDGTTPARFVDDLVVGAKLHLADQSERRPALALSAALSVPLVDQRGYIRTYDGLFTGSSARSLGIRFPSTPGTRGEDLARCGDLISRGCRDVDLHASVGLAQRARDAGHAVLDGSAGRSSVATPRADNRRRAR